MGRANLPARVIARAFPGHRLERCEPVAGGVLNTVYRIAVRGIGGEFALRIHTRDPGGCRKELDLHELVAARVPVPEVVFADPAGEAGAGPCMLMRWVPGETYRQIKARRDAREIAECGRALGGVLARIGCFRFCRGGILGPGLAIGPGPVEGADAVPRMIEKFLAVPYAAARLPGATIARVCHFAWARAPQLAALDNESLLVHSDFGSPNLVMHRPRGCWEVAAVLDWEFAFSGSPLYDAGHLLRYEQPGRPGLEPHFSQAWRDAGGNLPENWRDLARTLDLTALCEMLARPALPESVTPEIVAQIETTVVPC
jgi:aminoglycoside phosphotransferase (APT) family kinase protein